MIDNFNIDKNDPKFEITSLIAMEKRVINSMTCVLVGHENDGADIWWHVGYNPATDETNFKCIEIKEYEA